MKGYRKPSSDYLEVGDTTPVSSTRDHVFSATWSTDPLNPVVCWRLKTVAEQNAERDADLTTFLDSAGGKALKAIALVGTDKGVWTLAELRTKYRSL